MDTASQLMLAAGKGDRDAFTQLAQLVGQDIYRLALKLSRNEAVAEDIVQNVLIKLWRYAPRWKPKAKLSTYAYQLTYTTFIDHTRRTKRRNETALPETDSAYGAAEITSNLKSAHHSAQNSQQRKALLSALKKLGKRQRSAVMMSYYLEMSHQDVATAMDTTPRAVEGLLARARKRLGTILDPNLFGEIDHEHSPRLQ